MTQDMKHTIKTIVMLVALVMGATQMVWADKKTENGFTVLLNQEPNKDAGTVTITSIASDGLVTMTVTPKTGYFTRKSLISAERMIVAESARRRTSSVLADVIEITGSPDNDDEIGTTRTFTFTIPTGYNGANVIVRFYQKTPGLTQIVSLSEITTDGHYELVCDVDASNFTSIDNFTGTLDGGFHTISNLTKPLFTQTSGSAVVRNIRFDMVNISSGDANGNAGAIACEATGSSRIYNCGVLSGTVSGSNYVGSLVGKISGTARVINCYSFAEVRGGTVGSGIVGFNSEKVETVTIENQSINIAINQANVDNKPMIMNCMFYGDITSGSKKYPVYGGSMIRNDGTTSVNGYNYYRVNKYDEASEEIVDDVTFDDTGFDNINDYNRTWPADVEYLTRYEYYRNILNSNRQLCTFWVTGKTGTTQTAADTSLIAKWVLDPSIAPYPILKKWGKYASVINPDPDKTWNKKTKSWIGRSTANAYEGKNLGTLKVNVNAGSHKAGAKPSSVTLYLPITDMDTLNCDYGYAKVQLPYYNEQFGDPTVSDEIDPDAEDPEANHKQRYGGNYTDYVVTGWEITSITDDRKGQENAKPRNKFEENWERGYNFADRNCIDKDLTNSPDGGTTVVGGRILAQGGYFYVPEDVSEITITAHWGKAVYLRNADHYVDRVNVTAGSTTTSGKDSGGKNVGSPFTPAGTLPTTYHGNDVFTNWQTAIKALGEDKTGNPLTVYDQAIVLVGNLQVQNRSLYVGVDLDSKWHPHTMMSVDLDMDNEPDYCFQLQFRQQYQRRGIQPIRFDFLTIPELGLAIRHNQRAYAIGIFVPQGHFEITETACMHTTQFEYDAGSGTGDNDCGPKKDAPMILNGGHFEQMVVRYGPQNKTTYFLMGGHFRMKRFTPGAHANPNNKPKVRLCAVNCIGGEYPELYLSGFYHPDIVPSSVNSQGNPHCYTNGGKFGTMAGAGYDKILGDVFFKIDHSIIREFYGGGINAARPIGGNIDVTINNSIVYEKYCGGPKVGPMTSGKTVTTKATNTIFNKYYGGGNGGNSYYRKSHTDGDKAWPTENATGWNGYGYSAFNPLRRYVTDKDEGDLGYDAIFEFEVFNASNGIDDNCVIRTYYNYLDFGKTTTGDVSNTLIDCIVKDNFFGGGNLGNVTGDVKSTLTNTHVMRSAFAGGYSAAIPTFRVHDKSKTHFPHRDKTGTITDGGSIEYKKGTDGNEIYYEWTNDKPEGVSDTKPEFWDDVDKKWKCYTKVPLTGLGEVSKDATITINGTSQIDGNVYGGGDESAVQGTTKVNVMESAIIGGISVDGGDVYGGGNVADVGGATKVILLGGIVNGDVYGGGKGRLEIGTSGQADYVSPKAATVGDATVYLNGMEKVDYTETEYGTLNLAHTPDSDNPYIVADNKTGCVVKGNVFGCNNLNGTPLGKVKVHVYGTQNESASTITDPDDTAEGDKTAKINGRYDVKAVYGGGNLAPYKPTNSDLVYNETNKTTLDALFAEVIIDGCDRTSIKQVYGGGNAASTPATKVNVYGTYEIGELFGGGNGKDKITVNGVIKDNPGANVGYEEYADDATNAQTPSDREANYGYGSGKAEVNIYGGKIHSIYGGSNTKGNVRRIALAMLEELQDGEKPICRFDVDEAYGGGKSATMDGEAHLEMKCIPGMTAAYGGAENADIQNNVTLNITNGKFGQVFGGNNYGGRIMGSITVNIEETGCRPIIIGELYGGGNRASYSVYGYKPETDEDGIVYDEFDKIRWLPLVKDESITVSGETYTALTEKYPYPQVNVKSFTSIGEVYGGGYGTTATMVGDPHVNINVAMGDKTNHAEAKIDAEGILTIIDETEDHVETTREVKYPTHTQGKIGAIRNVFGGGNAARVTGDTYVNIGTQEFVKIETLKEGDSVKGYYKKVNDEFTACADTDTAIEGEPYYKALIGADIRGNVYGGGNKAEVTGSTNVTIGKQTTP